MAKNQKISEEGKDKLVFDFVCSQIACARRSKEKINRSSRFYEDLDLTNLDVAMLMYDLEEEFDAPILSDDKIDDVTTVGDLVLFVVGKTLTAV